MYQPLQLRDEIDRIKQRTDADDPARLTANLISQYLDARIRAAAPVGVIELDGCFRALKSSRPLIGLVPKGKNLRPYEKEQVAAHETIEHHWALIQLIANNPAHFEASASALGGWCRSYLEQQERLRNHPGEQAKHHQTEQQRRIEAETTLMSTAQIVEAAEKESGTEIVLHGEEIIIPRSLGVPHTIRLKARRSDVVAFLHARLAERVAI